MSDYSWNRTGEIDEFARDLEQKLQYMTPPPGSIKPPPRLEEEVERGRQSRTRELWVGATIIIVIAGVGATVLMN